jgi:hypothetical protein
MHKEKKSMMERSKGMKDSSTQSQTLNLNVNKHNSSSMEKRLKPDVELN